jgi:hypothetical protein
LTLSIYGIALALTAAAVLLFASVRVGRDRTRPPRWHARSRI